MTTACLRHRLAYMVSGYRAGCRYPSHPRRAMGRRLGSNHFMSSYMLCGAANLWCRITCTLSSRLPLAPHTNTFNFKLQFYFFVWLVSRQPLTGCSSMSTTRCMTSPWTSKGPCGTSGEGDCVRQLPLSDRCGSWWVYLRPHHPRRTKQEVCPVGAVAWHASKRKAQDFGAQQVEATTDCQASSWARCHSQSGLETFGHQTPWGSQGCSPHRFSQELQAQALWRDPWRSGALQETCEGEGQDAMAKAQIHTCCQAQTAWRQEACSEGRHTAHWSCLAISEGQIAAESKFASGVLCPSAKIRSVQYEYWHRGEDLSLGTGELVQEALLPYLHDKAWFDIGALGKSLVSASVCTLLHVSLFPLHSLSASALTSAHKHIL